MTSSSSRAKMSTERLKPHRSSSSRAAMARRKFVNISTTHSSTISALPTAVQYQHYPQQYNITTTHSSTISALPTAVHIYTYSKRNGEAKGTCAATCTCTHMCDNLYMYTYVQQLVNVHTCAATRKCTHITYSSWIHTLFGSVKHYFCIYTSGLDIFLLYVYVLVIEQYC
eukprot:GHVQ01022342.1.p1 GENE.GHVQ01022342.1~~GHVQ01022342.1.p1  ORF type:complete len:170 (+),score=12.35 GHVQ01022342.1:69-578(+)